MATATAVRPMNYRLFGRTGIRASELILGTMTFGDAWGEFGAPEDVCRRIFDAYVERGGNMIDTANLYTAGQSEEIVGRLLQGRRDDFVLATKYTFNPSTDDPNAGGNHRKNIVRSVEASLRRLQTDYIDLYWVHMWDGTVSAEDVVRALDDLVRAGKILHPAISDAPAWIVAEANTIARFRGYEPFAALQVEWNLLERTVERDLVPMARAFGLPITPWSPLAGGTLTGKYRQNGASGRGARAEQAGGPTDAVVDAVIAIAGELGASPAQVALAWLMAQGRDVFPILGARKLDQFLDNLAALDVTFASEHLERLADASAVPLGFPHEFLARALAGKLPGNVFGVPSDRMDLGTR